MNKKTFAAFMACLLIVSGGIIKAGNDYWYPNSGVLRTFVNLGIRVPKVLIIGNDNATSTAALAIQNASSTVGLYVNNGAKVGIGTANPAAPLDVTSTTSGILIPRMTTTQRDASATTTAGFIIYNTSTNKLNIYSGSAWEAVSSAQ